MGIPCSGASAFALLVRFFDGARLDEKLHDAAYVVTVDDDGWLHSAMISAGELLVRPDGSAGLALWRQSLTRDNVERTGQATVLAVLEGRAVRARFEVSQSPVDAEGLSLFTGRIVTAAADTAKYAQLRSGARFDLVDPAATRSRWESTLKALAAQ